MKRYEVMSSKERFDTPTYKILMYDIDKKSKATVSKKVRKWSNRLNPNNL